MPVRVAAAGGAGGLVALVVGTFLPWLRSGRVSRNSYEADGTIQRLLGVRGLGHAALTAWPFLGGLCAAAVALFALGLQRLAAVLAALVAVAAGGVAIATLRVPAAPYAAPASAGPTVTILGAVLTLLMATLILFTPRRTGTREGEGHD